MRIAHVSDCYLPRLGGIEVQIGELAPRQQAAGHDVDVITSVGGGADDRPVRVHRPATGRDERIHYAASQRGAALVAGGGYDLVHVHLSTWSPLAFLAARAGCRAGVPVAATVHSMWGHVAPLWRATGSITGWRDWPIAWSAVSGAAARPVTAAVGGKPVSVLPNGIDPDRWVLPARPRDPRRVVIASVLRLAERKRPRQLLQMLAALRRAVPEQIRIDAVLIGDGPLRSRLTDELRWRRMADWVTLTGRLDRATIRDLYRDVDLYVAPATLESFGIAALEARAAGLPVVAHAGTGVADFVQHSVNGLLCGNDRAMVDALRRLTVDARLRTEIAAHNRTHRPAIDWDRVLRDCDALYARAHALAGRPMAATASR